MCFPKPLRVGALPGCWVSALLSITPSGLLCLGFIINYMVLQLTFGNRPVCYPESAPGWSASSVWSLQIRKDSPGDPSRSFCFFHRWGWDPHPAIMKLKVSRERSWLRAQAHSKTNISSEMLCKLLNYIRGLASLPKCREDIGTGQAQQARMLYTGNKCSFCWYCLNNTASLPSPCRVTVDKETMIKSVDKVG